MKLKLSRKQRLAIHALQWLTRWAALFESLVGILSLGFIHTGWEFRALVAITFLECRWSMEAKNEN